ncbi:hypothetical protein J2R99_001705 [Rhodopseudomonas julia]|uniref:Uncharacterized protein n=1 Tax=Rhodopseudomonas julia TaxID=200617 RepID=A0ABU0C5R0_9BRAD|nr:hypothetical protein [Rhodopseudomonas julia]MDQ0325856.1 hypothetical protein [Rhodopseudomonas julia]
MTSDVGSRQPPSGALAPVNKARFSGIDADILLGGDYVAKGAPHGFSALGEGPARMTLVSTPARHESFFQALSELTVPHDPQEVAAVCTAFDQAIPGPVVTP